MAVDYLAALNSGSGLDTKSIVQALVDADRAGPQSSIDRKTASVETQLSGLAQLKSAMENLRLAFSAVDDAKEFSFSSITNNNDTHYSAKLTGDPIELASYSIKVDTLAQKTVRVSDTFTSTTADLNAGVAGTFEFSIGSGDVQTISLDAGEVTLENLVTEINALDAGASASIIQVSDGNYKLLLESDETGLSNVLNIDTDLLGIGTEDADHHVQEAQDSVLIFNGINIQRSSNTIDDLIDGVELDLLSEGTTTGSLRVFRDNDAALSTMNYVVAAVNTFENIMSELTDTVNGDLANDSGVQSIRSKIRNFFFQEGSVAGDDIKTSTNLGVTVDRYGVFSLDEEKFSTAFDEHYEEVVNFMTAGTNNQSLSGEADRGLAGDVLAELEIYLKPNGFIQSRNTQQNNILKELDDDQIALDARIAAAEERYTQKFSMMNRIVDEMKSLQEYLDAQLDNLPFTSKKD